MLHQNSLVVFGGYISTREEVFIDGGSEKAANNLAFIFAILPLRRPSHSHGTLLDGHNIHEPKRRGRTQTANPTWEGHLLKSRYRYSPAWPAHDDSDQIMCIWSVWVGHTNNYNHVGGLCPADVRLLPPTRWDAYSALQCQTIYKRAFTQFAFHIRRFRAQEIFFDNIVCVSSAKVVDHFFLLGSAMFTAPWAVRSGKA